ncbi:hypothetical protein KSP40_PGU016517 [Platanthera guangdongensis]|uniref:Uncharacterized protein n=1 Tax=Platanthera guangdongensis TaxID=2320717 RepID=A0ABR2MDT6_9ASPA
MLACQGHTGCQQPTEDEKNLQIIYPWLLLLPPGEQHISVPWHLPKLTLGLDLEVTLEDGNKLNDGDGRGVAEVEDTKLGGPVLCSAEAGAFLCRVQERKIPWKTKLRQRAATIEAHRRQKLQKLGTRKKEAGKKSVYSKTTSKQTLRGLFWAGLF